MIRRDRLPAVALVAQHREDAAATAAFAAAAQRRWRGADRDLPERRVIDRLRRPRG